MDRWTEACKRPHQRRLLLHGVQRQTAVTAYLKSEQLLHVAHARWHIWALVTLVFTTFCLQNRRITSPELVEWWPNVMTLNHNKSNIRTTRTPWLMVKKTTFLTLLTVSQCFFYVIGFQNHEASIAHTNLIHYAKTTDWFTYTTSWQSYGNGTSSFFWIRTFTMQPDVSTRRFKYFNTQDTISQTFRCSYK